MLVVDQPGQVLSDTADAEALDWLVRRLRSAQAEWAKPVELGEWWDRPAVPFHVVLECPPDDAAVARDLWTAAGAELVLFPL